MLFNKEPGMKYTDMAIFFDENFYSENCDDEKCYKYMYLLYHMLASKKKYFYSYEDYDGFAIYATNMVYARFVKKKEQGLRIKSILNYIKATLYPLKVGYQRETYKQILNPNVNTNINEDMLQEKMRDQVKQQYQSELSDNIIAVFELIPNFIREIINKTPYKNDKYMSQKLYMSCLISLLKSFTLSNDNLQRFNNKIKNKTNITNEFISKILIKERNSSITLWRIEESMSDYIKLLTNLIRKKILDKLSEVRYQYILPDETIDTILRSTWRDAMLEPTVYEGEFE